MGEGGKGLLGLLVIGAIIYGAAHDDGSDSSDDTTTTASSASSADYGGDTESTYATDDSYDTSTLSGSSSCTEWNAASFSDQVALSQAIIERLNAYDTSSSYAESFAGNITTGCEPAGDLTVAFVAGSIASLADADFPPQ